MKLDEEEGFKQHGSSGLFSIMLHSRTELLEWPQAAEYK